MKTKQGDGRFSVPCFLSEEYEEEHYDSYLRRGTGVHCGRPGSHALDGVYEVTAEKVLEEFKKNPLLKGITLSGGDPILQAGELVGICREVHAMGKDVMTYTGYTYEELLEMQKTDEGIRQLLEETDTLVDGRFILAQRDLTLIYKGSRNQRIIDMNRTRAEGKLVLDPVEEENLRPEE